MYSVADLEMSKIRQREIDAEIRHIRLVQQLETKTHQSLPKQRLVVALGSLTLAVFVITQVV